MNQNYFDAIVILGGGRHADGSLTTLSKAKLDTGANVIKKGTVKSAVVMGKIYRSYTPDKGFFEKEGALLRRDYLITHWGIKPEKIEIILDECMDTFYEAFASRKLAEEKRYKKVLLCTSANHIRRALFIFQRIYGKKIKVLPVKNPCEDSLNPKLEVILYKLANTFLSLLPEEIPSPISWDMWFEENRRIYYDKYLKIINKFHQKGTLSKDAYKSIVEDKKA